MNLVELYGHSDTYVDVLVKDVAALTTATLDRVASVEWIGDVGERAIARVTMTDSVIEEGLDIDTIVENMNYFMFIGADAFRSLSQLANILHDLDAPYQIREVFEPREDEEEKRGVYIYIQPIHPLVGMMLEGFLMAMDENGTNVLQGTATGVTAEGEEAEHVFILFPERVSHVVDPTCIVSVSEYMSAATSEVDWQARKQVVMDANGGSMPSFWFLVEVIALAEARANW